ncbi:MAG: hypothetical protein PHE17_21325 [Thiothrix sp.]|uniref:hypothetical protein n=1 Tax=Thiothrix sp. TaxID=1032 RepID=UPI0026068534|nr:hypothetical protein [Thiothrix sp.]MDD5395572.1 hypothetical protein [Thiothrix sp.]
MALAAKTNYTRFTNIMKTNTNVFTAVAVLMALAAKALSRFINTATEAINAFGADQLHPALAPKAQAANTKRTDAGRKL